MASLQTVVQYGALTITQCLTTGWVQRDERDPSGADVMFSRFSITVQGFVHAKNSDSSSVGVTPRSSTISQTYEGVSQILSAPRLQFKYRVGCNDSAGGGETVFDIQEADSTGKIDPQRDVDNGPRCTQFAVTGVVANVLWKVQATFEFAIVNCARGGSNDSRVLSNRWSVSDTIDRDRYTSRTYSGRLRMSSGKINPNSFRGLVVPTLSPGMRRASMDFQAAANGLELAYTIVDTEAAYAAPEPATNWEIVHTERSSMNSTPIGVGDISVTLTGDRNVNRQELIALGLKVMNDRLREGAALALNSHFLTDLSVTDYWGSEGPLRIVVQASVLHTAQAKDGDAQKGVVIASAKIGTDIPTNLILGGYDRHRSRDGRGGQSPATEGPIPLTGAFVTYLQTACSNTHDIGQNQDTTIIDVDGRDDSGPKITGRIVPSLPDNVPRYVDPSHGEAVYMEYRMESRYSTGMHRVVLPIADDPGARYRSSNADPTDTQRVVTLAPPTTGRTMRIRASRIGREPELPEPVDTYRDGETVAHLLNWIALPAVPSRTGDGKQLIVVEAEYHYALTRPVKTKDAVRVGVAPWDRLGLQKTSQAMLGTYSEDSRGGMTKV